MSYFEAMLLYISGLSLPYIFLRIQIIIATPSKDWVRWESGSSIDVKNV